MRRTAAENQLVIERLRDELRLSASEVLASRLNLLLNEICVNYSIYVLVPSVGATYSNSLE